MLVASFQLESSGMPFRLVCAPLRSHDREEPFAERRVETSDETVWRCVLKLGPRLTRTLRRLWPKPIGTGHLDELIAWIGGRPGSPDGP